jgi:hypothetical protein
MLREVLAAVILVGAALILVGYVAWLHRPELPVESPEPQQTIANFRPGTLGRVSGVVEVYQGKLLRAPFSGRSCVAYATELEGPGPRHERCAFAAVPFLVEDGSGRALVFAGRSDVFTDWTGDVPLVGGSPAGKGREGVLVPGARIALVGHGVVLKGRLIVTSTAMLRS